MAVWSELDGMLEIGYCIFNVGTISSAIKARLESRAETLEPFRHVCMSIWSELDSILEVGY